MPRAPGALPPPRPSWSSWRSALGGDKPSRRIRAAEHHFKAGDADRARTLLESTIDQAAARAAARNRAELAGRESASTTTPSSKLPPSRSARSTTRTPIRPCLVQTLMSLAFAQGMSGEFDDSLRNARQAVTHAEQLALSGADQSGARDVGRHDIPLRARQSTKPACSAHWRWRIPTPTCQSRSAPAPSMPWCWPGPGSWTRPAAGRWTAVRAAMYRARRRERHDGGHRVLHADRDLAGQLRRSCTAGRRHDGTRRAGRRFARRSR